MASAGIGLSEHESELLHETEFELESELESEFESEFESGFESEFEAVHEHESEMELSPIRRVYSDAMMEHMAHAAAEAESEHEAAEHFLPLIPMIAGKLLPLAAKALPKVMKALPRIMRTVNRVTPQLTRGVNQITRTLFRRPRSRRLVQTIPSIARRTVYRIARQAASGRPVTPQAAVRVLHQQARRVLGSPSQAKVVVRRSNALDRTYHRAAGIPYRPLRAGQTFACGRCGSADVRSAAVCCRCCGQLVTR